MKAQGALINVHKHLTGAAKQAERFFSGVHNTHGNGNKNEMQEIPFEIMILLWWSNTGTGFAERLLKHS